MPNQLAKESSPHLLQHAENPVAWYPWGNAALNLAREKDRPVFRIQLPASNHWQAIDHQCNWAVG